MHSVKTPVIFYGCGKVGKEIAKRALKYKMNAVCFIDGNFTGEVEILPVYKPDSLPRLLGENEDAVVVITTIKPDFITQIKENLHRLEVKPEQVYGSFDDFLSDVYIENEKRYCWHLLFDLEFGDRSTMYCCGARTHYYPVSTIPNEMQNIDGLKIAFNNFLTKRKEAFDAAKKGLIPFGCENCYHLTDQEIPDELPKFSIIGVNFYPSVCNADCVYCGRGRLSNDKCNNLQEAKKLQFPKFIVEELVKLKNNNMISEETTICYNSGEISITPDNELLLSYAIDNPNFIYVILTNAIVYSPLISQILSQNKRSRIMVDMDSGTPETYLKVKGVNKFYKVIENLKKYVAHGTVEVKYIILPDMNDDDANLYGTVNVAKELKLQSLTIALETFEKRDKFVKRKMYYAAAKLMNILAENDIKTVFHYDWIYEEIKEVKRLAAQMKLGKKGEEQKIIHNAKTPIIFYGCGKVGKGRAKEAIKYGMNVVCFIDGNFTGEVEALPVYKPDFLPRLLGENEGAVVVITTVNPDFIAQIKENLQRLGIKSEQVYDDDMFDDFLSEVVF